MRASVLISAAELDEAIRSEEVVLIDTSDAAHYAEAHFHGAVSIREIFTYLATTTPQGLGALRATFAAAFGKAGLSVNETAVVYEQAMAPGFAQSCRGYILLRYLGYPRDKVKVLHGWLPGVECGRLPSTTEVFTPACATFPTTDDDNGLLLDLGEMKRIADDPRIVKLDVRIVDEWIGASSSPYGEDFCPRKGRIPHSVWIEWVPHDEAVCHGAALQVGRENPGVRLTPSSLWKKPAYRTHASTLDHGTSGRGT